MREKEKMLSLMLYNPSDEELTKDRAQLKRKIRLFNQMDRESEDYYKMLCSIIPKIGKNSWIEAPFFCDYGYNIEIGDNFYANTNLTILDCAKVNIGDNVLIGPNVSMLTPIHPMNHKERAKMVEYAKPITIQDDVWIAGNVTIIAGITIGARSVVGAGSVVTKDVLPDTFVAGNPAKVIKHIVD